MRYRFFCYVHLLAGGLSLLLQTAHANIPSTPGKVATLQQKISDTESSVAKTAKEEQVLQDKLRSLEKNISQNEEQLRTIQNDFLAHKKTLALLKTNAKNLAQQYQSEQTAMHDQLSARFKHHKQEQLQLIFGHHEMDKITRVKHYYQYFNQARQEYIDGLAKATDEVVINQKAIEAKQATLIKLKGQYIQDAKALADDKAQRQALLNNLSSTLAHKKNKLKQQQLELEQLTKAINQKVASLKLKEPKKPFSALKGQLAFPLTGQYSVTTLSNHLLKTKRHLYLEAQEGEVVNAISDGYVVFADWLKGVGFLIIIDHSDGYMSLYGNNQILYKSPGDIVKSGDKISLVGQSGGQPKPGLYFEIRKDGEPLDPNQWFGTA